MRNNKPGRKEEPLGSKIQANPKIVSAIVKMLTEDPKISNLAISNRLRAKPWNFSTSAPTVKAWIENFYPSIDKKIKEKMEVLVLKEDNDWFHIASIRVDQIQKLKELISKVEARIEHLESLRGGAEEEEEEDDVGVGSSLSIPHEAQYESYIKTLAVLRQQLLQLLGPEDLFEKFSSVVETTVNICLDNLKDCIPEDIKAPKIEVIYSSITELLADLKNEHSI